MDTILLHYRTGTGTGLQATLDKSPLDIYAAFAELKAELLRRGAFAQLERSFVNKALHACRQGLHALKNPDTFAQLYTFLLEEGFDALGITQKRGPYYLTPLYVHDYLQYKRMLRLSPEAYRRKREGRGMGFMRISFQRAQRLFFALRRQKRAVGKAGRKNR